MIKILISRNFSLNIRNNSPKKWENHKKITNNPRETRSQISLPKFNITSVYVDNDTELTFGDVGPKVYDSYTV